MKDLSRVSGTNPLKEPPEPSALQDEKIQRILDNWHDVELLLERSGRADKVVAEMESYISDLRSDLRALKFMRWGMIGFVGIYVAFINALLLCLIFFHQWFFFWIGPYGRVALILAAVSSTVILLAKILMGLFKTHGERNKDEFVSPALQQAIEATKIAANSST